MKDEGIVKKTQEAINEKVMPAAREGLESAQELLEKGASLVGELIKDAGKKTEKVSEAAGELTRTVRKDAEEVLGRTGEKLVATKNDAFAHFRKSAEEASEEVHRVRDDVRKDVRAKSREAVDFTKTKAAQVGAETPRRGRKVVKSAAGVAVLAAAAAGAYAYYRNRQEKDEAIKAEFSEKMKKWNEMGDAELVNAEAEIPARMHVRPTRIYRVGQNAQLGDDIIVNVTWPGEELAQFNPDEVSEAINPVEELRKRAESAMDTAGETARRVAGTVGEKAREAVAVATEKAEEAYAVAQEKAEEVRTRLAERRQDGEAMIQDNEEGLDDMERDIRQGFKEAKRAPEHFNTAETARQSMKMPTEARPEDLKDFSEEDLLAPEDGLQQLSHDLEEGLEDAKQAVSDELENKLETPPGDESVQDDVVENDVVNEYDLEHITWEDDESVLMQKTENLRNKTQEGFLTLKEKFLEARDYLEERVNRAKPEPAEETEEELYAEELQITVHNRGNKDYFFSPMLIQRYNSSRRETTPVPAHEVGTTLEQRIIKPGETYQGTLVLRKTDSDDAIIMFEDMLMKSSVAILLDEDLDDLFLEEETYDRQDDLLFEGIEGDLEDYDFADEDGLDLDLDDLDVEEAEELSFDYSEDDPKV